MLRRVIFLAGLSSWCLAVLVSTPPAWGLQPIEEAFGIRLGAEFAPSSAPDAYTTLDGQRAYYLEPVQPSRFFSSYLVQITPLTHKIHTIIGIGESDNLETCKKEREAFLPALTEKHGDSFQWVDPEGPAFQNDYEIILQADQKRGLGISCGGDAEIILQIVIVDDDLSDLAEVERRHMNKERTTAALAL